MPRNHEDELSEFDARHHRLRQEFSAYRLRTRREAQDAAQRSRDETVADLVEVLDDCDRALETLDGQAAESIQVLASTVAGRFRSLGYEPFGEEGDVFDPEMHAALAAQPGDREDGTILRVHKRGWARADGTVIRPAMVIVCQNDHEQGEAET